MATDSQETSSGRRHFLIGIGVIAAGTAVGIKLVPQVLREPQPPVDFKPHAFVRISSDDVVTVVIGKSEMGQGIYTGLPMILAEELDVDPRRLRVEFAPIDPAFNHPTMRMQFTGGSNSTLSTFDALREAGAIARGMLVAAAAQQWGVDAASLRTDDGVVTDGSRRASYGSLAALASTLPQPEAVPPLKPRDQFRWIGRPQQRLDGFDKVTGRARFGLDVDLPDMLTAVVARSPVFGGKVVSFDPSAALAVPGVVEVKQIPSGIAVIARHTWAALRGREALRVDWDPGPGASLSTESQRAEWRRLAQQPGLVALNRGDALAALRSASKTLDVEYELPYLAHACMEPLNCVAHVREDGCEIWVGTQNQSQDVMFVAKALGIDAAKITLHTQFLGGGFGRRASTASDFTVEAVHVANGVGKPVKTVWTREDDTRGGYYRPFSVNRIRAGVDASGLPVAYVHTTVSKPVLAQSIFAPFIVKDGIDPTSFEGSVNMAYAIPNLRAEVHNTEEPVPILWWRSVGHSINGFVTNSAIDEIAVLGGRDPADLRRALLAGKPRHLAVLDKVVAEAGWGQPLPAGRARGIALQESFESIVAQVAEVSVDGGEVRVHRVTCAVDCGLAINPDQVVAQMESGILYGLSAALYGEITLENGVPQQSNFDGYRILRQSEVPAIDVHIVASDGPIGGIGEPGTPPIAPAVCNAIYAATGKRIRRLPISASLT
jgi:isoquinoline 1-oxidoreductase beta subunit